MDDNVYLYEAQQHITAADFYTDIHKKIFEKMIQLSRDNQGINMITLGDEMQDTDGIFTILTGITQAGWGASGNQQYLARRIKEYSVKRYLSEFLSTKVNDLDKKLATDMIAEIGAGVAKIYSATNTENPDVKDIIKRVENLQVETKDRLSRGEKYIGMPCGIEKIDRALSGIRRYFYYLVNAYTSTGKTMFSLNIANNILESKKRVVFFSLEMSQEDIVSRILAIRSGINSISIAMGSHMDDRNEIRAKGELYDMDLQVYSQKRELEEIILTMISENLKKPVDLFIIDYLQHIKVKKTDSRYDRYTEASNEIQRITGEIGVPVMVLSQIDNISARTKQTDVIATKGSGDVPADADVVILLQKDKPRQDYYQDGFNAVNAIIQKNRHGITGNVELIMHTKDGRFYEADRYSHLTGRQ
jgi:replicative DNA helicase